MSLADVTIIKSTGPDMTKIIETMESFGPDYTYIVLGYPPFLKNLVDDNRINFDDYDAIAGFGGEGMSENMRAYLLQYFREVIGSYGASDLEINIAAETELTIALRREILQNPGLRAALTRTEYGVTPMIFQYNSFDYVIETNAKGELLVSICRRENLSPRIRYNIHDRGHVVRLRDLVPLLKKHKAESVLKDQLLDLPLLFHYGRSDLSLDFYGATITPDSIREYIYSRADLARDIETYRMVGYEDSQANKQLLFAFKLKPGVPVSKYQRAEIETEFLSYLRDVNRDFGHAYADAKPSTRPKLVICRPGTGVFSEESHKLKNEYVWQISAAQAKSFGLIKGDK
jgi:phenylacetate-CoA ligase